MGTTTILRNLSRLRPESETEHRRIQSMGHRVIGRTGDEAWAKMEEQAIRDIREGRVDGDSRTIRLCRNCMSRGQRYPLIEEAGELRCFTCGQTEPKKP